MIKLVVIDKGIPFLDNIFPKDIEVLYLSPEDITPEIVHFADALFVRTRTNINAELLENSKVRFVVTATIGFDHIDQDYCAKKGIQWTSCPGCNAQAVCDYVEEAISTLKPEKTVLTIGVVGYGNVGKLVARMAENKGHRVILCDPPLGIGVSLSELAPQCDVITFHTPLTREGDHPTYHLCNQEVLGLCKQDALIINAARGGVIDEQALLSCLSSRRLLTTIDCWEEEPNVNRELLQKVDLASYHIAGYSIQGKMNASEMCLRAFCDFFSLPILSINKKIVPLQGDSDTGWLQRISNQLKARPEAFEQLRKQYKLR